MKSLLIKLSLIGSVLMASQALFAKNNRPSLAEDSWAGMESLKTFLEQQNVAVKDCHSSAVLTLLSVTQKINKSPWATTQDGNTIVINKYDRVLAKSKVFLVKELQKESDSMGLTCNVSELASSISNLE